MQHSEHIEFVSPAELPASGYTPVVTVTGGKTIYLSGQVAFDAERSIVGRGDFRAQAQQVFENLKRALAAAGADFSHVVRFNIYLLDRANLPILREVRDQYVNTTNPPASTLVIVSGLFQEEFLVEIDAIASLPA